ncbi:MAG: hypothetical protein KY464_10880 [Gemmatimonadetes bacterium]|nr:hypothetical protein [Gemmatimonadota bacterium]
MQRVTHRTLIVSAALACLGACSGAGEDAPLSDEAADSLAPNMVTGTTGAPGPGTTGTPGTPGATDPDTISDPPR